ncbi:head GIN domain-containing protein [Marinirhabdus gelatinilytica]|uniref:Putative autotransporter adhesin-like protein n=1 Tax=Marinirhabdus gelatinilytica TaxID=1703343 RepID=A0A370QAF3_9FLAO|nr:head GIN domain-containing protein [Marinirhabdus gelatinilytica]RDK85337.1 putative autotransporter adhesin-like protein [Marinirhabdus gelatinilytica]
MKNTIKLSIVAMLTLFVSLPAAAQWGNKKIKGSGNVTTSKVTTQGYDEVAGVGSLTVILTSGAEGNITIEADDNLHEYIEVESNGTQLKVKMKKGYSYSSKNDIIVTVPFTEISKVSITGSGDVISKNTIKGDNLAFTVTGSGDLQANVEGNTIDAKVTGSGDMVLTGTANMLEVKVAGSGDFEGNTLNAADTQVYVSGSGDATVMANGTFKARVTGSGDIRYKGKPTKSDTKVIGSGSIESM